MSYSTGRLALPNHHETLDRLNLDVSVQTLDGKFPAWAGGGGRIEVDFKANPGPEPHSGYGSISLYDGSGTVILSIVNAIIQIEEGPKDGVWRTMASFIARGLDSEAREVAFGFAQQNALDTTSLIVDFALADTNSVQDAQTVLEWAEEIQAVTDEGLPKPVQKWLEAEGVAIDKFEAFLKELGVKLDAPASWLSAAIAWLETTARLTPAKVLTFVAVALGELKSGKPGFNSDSAGGA